MSPDDFPLDIWRDEILLRLPAECLFRLRAVCKRWCRVIDDPNFARAHTNHQLISSSSHSSDLVITYSSASVGIGPLSSESYSLYTFLEASNFDNGAKIISGSSLALADNESSPLELWALPLSTCNGLVLFDDGAQFLEIWNLSTNERLQLPPLLDFSSNRQQPAFTGLGYDHAAQDFKAVAIQGQQARVYSLRSDTWRELTGDCPCIEPYIGDGFWWTAYHGVFMCGALHWLSSSDNSKIVALDLGTEKHRIIQLHPSHENITHKNIDVLGGCLLVVSGVSVSDSHFVLWVMKDYGSDDDESWTKLLSMKTERGLTISWYGRLRPVAYVKDKNQVFVKDSTHEGFLVLDVESNSIKKRIRIQGFTGYFEAQIIQRSIFRLRDHCGVGGTSRIKPFNNRTRKNMEVSITINTE